MSRIIRFLIIFIVASLVSPFFLISKGHAQFGVGVAEYYPVAEEVEDGDLIALHDNIYAKANRRFDANVIGVVSTESAVEINNSGGEEGYYPILSDGVAYTKVSTLNGKIEIGDNITSSEIPGVGIKLVEGEGANPIGVAREAYAEDDAKKIGLIKVHLYKKSSTFDENDPYQENLITAILGKFSVGQLQRYETPSQLLRVFLAACVIILSFILAFLTFRKIAGRGVEALGRNPLAGRMIFMHLVLDVIFTAFILIVGIVLGYFILTL